MRGPRLAGAEQVPGFAVAFKARADGGAAGFGARIDVGLVEDHRDGDDPPRVKGDDINGEEVDLAANQLSGTQDQGTGTGNREQETGTEPPAVSCQRQG